MKNDSFCPESPFFCNAFVQEHVLSRKIVRSRKEHILSKELTFVSKKKVATSSITPIVPTVLADML